MITQEEYDETVDRIPPQIQILIILMASLDKCRTLRGMENRRKSFHNSMLDLCEGDKVKCQRVLEITKDMPQVIEVLGVQ